MANSVHPVETGEPWPGSRHASTTVSGILHAVGVVAYAWDIASDELTWEGDTTAILKVSPEAISTGDDYSSRMEAGDLPGRRETVLEDEGDDDGDGVAYHIEYRLHTERQDEPVVWIEDIGRWYSGSDGRPVRAHGIVRTVNQRRARDERLLYRSDHDDLTGGLNRVRLVEELDAAISAAIRYRSSVAFAIVAVDNLTALNDAYGFDVADDVIAGVAARTGLERRAGDTIGRLSGNKLGIVLNRCTEEDLRTAARRFVAGVAAAPIRTRIGSVAATVSVGGVVLPRHGRDKGQALARAQEALEKARLSGCAGIVLFEPSPESEAARCGNAAIASHIVSALYEGRMALALQPIVSAGDNRIRFHEALCRINLDDGTQLTASDFIETAERLGIVRLVDNHTLDLAIAELLEDPGLTLSVNVSASSALDGKWLSQITAHLCRHRGLAERLIVEITETVAINDIDRAIEFVRAIRALGCRVAIDDFGAGHTSFRYLRALGADIVKIDGAFVERISENGDDRFFVAALVSLAQRIGLTTVAERVARESDAQILREIGVDYLQGHLFGEARQSARTGPGRRAI